MDHEAYAREKLSAAVKVMATSGASIQDRLLMASQTFGILDERHFATPEGRALWLKHYASLTAVKDGDPAIGRVAATMRKIRKRTAERIADDLWALYEEVMVNQLIAAAHQPS